MEADVIFNSKNGSMCNLNFDNQLNYLLLCSNFIISHTITDKVTAPQNDEQYPVPDRNAVH
jgi:hypothetical protein